MTSNQRLATVLARRLFKAGDDSNSPTQRIEFKGRHHHWRTKERAQGGLNEEALARFLKEVLDEVMPQDETTAYTEEAQEIRSAALQDLAYFNGAKQAAAMAHQSLKNMDAWIAGGCGDRWSEAKRELAGLPVEPSGERCGTCGHLDRYHFDDGHGNVVCRFVTDCACVHRERVSSAMAYPVPRCTGPHDLQPTDAFGDDARHCTVCGIAEYQLPEKTPAPPCGNPVMINAERYRGCRLPSGHEGECSPQKATCDPCTQWDADGLCVTCGASMPVSPIACNGLCQLNFPDATCPVHGLVTLNGNG